jgi:hypothetical protein
MEMGLGSREFSKAWHLVALWLYRRGPFPHHSALPQFQTTMNIKSRHLRLAAAAAAAMLEIITIVILEVVHFEPKSSIKSCINEGK